MNDEITHPEMTFGKEIRFTPYAYAKLIWMRDRGTTEVAGYGVTATSDPLLVTDFVLIKQKCTIVTFDLDPIDGAEYMERMMDHGLMPWQYSNILIHTHPGNSPNPSEVDETNFVSAFTHPNWAMMFIIAEGGSTYCRLKMNVGPGSVSLLNCVVEYGDPFAGSDEKSWGQEYKEKVSHEKFRMTGKERVAIATTSASHLPSDLDIIHNDPLWYDQKDDKWIGETQAHQDAMAVDDLLNDMDCYWSNDGEEVIYWKDNCGPNDDLMSYHYNPDTKKWYEDDGEGLDEISRPDGPMVGQIEAWAIKFADERPEVAK